MAALICVVTMSHPRLLAYPKACSIAAEPSPDPRASGAV